jgi:oligopeptide transport system permease protein
MTRLVRFTLPRLLWMILVVFGVSVLTFLLMHSIPGNPWEASSEQRALSNVSIDPGSMRELERQFGLDHPLWQQYTIYMFGSLDESKHFICGAVCGNLGVSFRERGNKVTEMFFAAPEGLSPWQSRFGYTIRLAMLGFFLVTLIGIPLGVSLAIREGTIFERAISSIFSILVAVPNFILGILLILVLASWLHWIRVLPNWNDPSAWIVPVLVLAAVPTVNLARMTQAAIREAMAGEYVRAARAKGLRQFRIVSGHIFPNALVPILTFLVPLSIELVAGSFIVEALFGFPGLGREFWLSIQQKDYPVIMGLVLLYSSGIVIINGLVEVFYGVMDPRLRVEAGVDGQPQ